MEEKPDKSIKWRGFVLKKHPIELGVYEGLVEGDLRVRILDLSYCEMFKGIVGLGAAMHSDPEVALERALLDHVKKVREHTDLSRRLTTFAQRLGESKACPG
jgi:hypothetical protein